MFQFLLVALFPLETFSNVTGSPHPLSTLQSPSWPCGSLRFPSLVPLEACRPRGAEAKCLCGEGKLPTVSSGIHV